MPFQFSWIVGQYNVVSFALKFINLKITSLCLLLSGYFEIILVYIVFRNIMFLKLFVIYGPPLYKAIMNKITNNRLLL